MTSTEAAPRALRAVANLFLLFGLLDVAEIFVQLALGNFYITTGLLWIPICFGLRRRSAGWRQVALIVLWWGFIVLALAATLSQSGSVPSYFELFGVRIAEVPGWVVAVAGVLFLASTCGNTECS